MDVPTAGGSWCSHQLFPNRSEKLVRRRWGHVSLSSCGQVAQLSVGSAVSSAGSPLCLCLRQMTRSGTPIQVRAATPVLNGQHTPAVQFSANVVNAGAELNHIRENPEMAERGRYRRAVLDKAKSADTETIFPG